MRFFSLFLSISACFRMTTLIRLMMQLSAADCAGQNTHFLLSTLIKHLDHKSVLKQPEMQLDIIQVATALARLSKIQSSVAIVGAVSDVMRHLRKSIHNRLDEATLGDELVQWNRKFHDAVDECLRELSSKVTQLFSSHCPVLSILTIKNFQLPVLTIAFPSSSRLLLNFVVAVEL